MANERGLLPVCLYYKHIIATPSPQFSMSLAQGLQCNSQMALVAMTACL